MYSMTKTRWVKKHLKCLRRVSALRNVANLSSQISKSLERMELASQEKTLMNGSFMEAEHMICLKLLRKGHRYLMLMGYLPRQTLLMSLPKNLTEKAQDKSTSGH